MFRKKSCLHPWSSLLPEVPTYTTEIKWFLWVWKDNLVIDFPKMIAKTYFKKTDTFNGCFSVLIRFYIVVKVDDLLSKNLVANSANS